MDCRKCEKLYANDGVMPVLMKGQCACCGSKERLGKYGDTDIDVSEDCYRNGNFRKWLDDNIGTEA
jgi:hypothetical protein